MLLNIRLMHFRRLLRHTAFELNNCANTANKPATTSLTAHGEAPRQHENIRKIHFYALQETPAKDSRCCVPLKLKSIERIRLQPQPSVCVDLLCPRRSLLSAPSVVITLPVVWACCKILLCHHAANNSCRQNQQAREAARNLGILSHN